MRKGKTPARIPTRQNASTNQKQRAVTEPSKPPAEKSPIGDASQPLAPPPSSLATTSSVISSRTTSEQSSLLWPPTVPPPTRITTPQIEREEHKYHVRFPPGAPSKGKSESSPYLSPAPAITFKEDSILSTTSRLPEAGQSQGTTWSPRFSSLTETPRQSTSKPTSKWVPGEYNWAGRSTNSSPSVSGARKSWPRLPQTPDIPHTRDTWGRLRLADEEGKLTSSLRNLDEVQQLWATVSGENEFSKLPAIWKYCKAQPNKDQYKILVNDIEGAPKTYHLHTDILGELSREIEQFQDFLKDIAHVVYSDSSYFVIDPNGKLVEGLAGSLTPGKFMLNDAVLKDRLSKAKEYANKLYERRQGQAVTSPATIISSVFTNALKLETDEYAERIFDRPKSFRYLDSEQKGELKQKLNKGPPSDEQWSKGWPWKDEKHIELPFYSPQRARIPYYQQKEEEGRWEGEEQSEFVTAVEQEGNENQRPLNLEEPPNHPPQSQTPFRNSSFHQSTPAVQGNTAYPLQAQTNRENPLLPQSQSTRRQRGRHSRVSIYENTRMGLMGQAPAPSEPKPQAEANTEFRYRTPPHMPSTQPNNQRGRFATEPRTLSGAPVPNHLSTVPSSDRQNEQTQSNRNFENGRGNPPFENRGNRTPGRQPLHNVPEHEENRSPGRRGNDHPPEGDGNGDGFNGEGYGPRVSYTGPPSSPPPEQTGSLQSRRFEVRFDNKLKPDKVYKFTGEDEDIIPFYFRTNELAQRGMSVYRDLGSIIPDNFKPKSKVERWWAALTPEIQNRARQDWGSLWGTISLYFLSERWSAKYHSKYEEMTYEKFSGTPAEYLEQKSLLYRILHQTQDGPDMIRSITYRLPDLWWVVLGPRDQFQRLQDLMVMIYNNQHTIMNLKGSGDHRGSSARRGERNRSSKAAYNSEATIFKSDADQEDSEDSNSDEDQARKEAHAVTRPSRDKGKGRAKDNGRRDDRRTGPSNSTDMPKDRKPPYPYPRDNENRSRSKPKWPCKCCGSPYHWDPDCRFYKKFMARLATGETGIAERNNAKEYAKAFLAESRDKEDWDDEDLDNDSSDDDSGPGPPRTGVGTSSLKTSIRTINEGPTLSMRNPMSPEMAKNSVVMSEEEYEKESASEKDATRVNDPRKRQSKVQFHLPSDRRTSHRAKEGKLRQSTNQEKGKWTEGKTHQRPSERTESPSIHDSVLKNAFSIEEIPISRDSDISHLPPPKPDRKIRVTKREPTGERIACQAAGSVTETNAVAHKAPKVRSTPKGRSTLGISALAVQGWVGSWQGSPEILRLDSGADITLISKECLEALEGNWRVKQGLKLSLYQLTGPAKIGGYVTIPIFMKTEEGSLVEMEAEAYVVEGMKVPILLGEDFQVNYELSILRKEGQTHVQIGQNGRYLVSAMGNYNEKLGFQVRKSVASLTATERKSFVIKSKSRTKVRKGCPYARVAGSDKIRIPPESCARIPITGDFGEKEEWLIEKIVLENEDGSILSAPTTLISSKDPYISVANTSPHPKYLSPGEIVGLLKDPDLYLDNPRDAEERKKLLAHADSVRKLVQETLKEQGMSNPQEKEEEESTSDWLGPKTAETPDPTTYPSEKLEELLDISPDLPPELRPKAIRLFEKHVDVFGFDDRLGHHETKAPIRLKPDVEPIAVPMYGASPAKRLVIDEQIDKWIEQEVIEPSVSPWSAPVVIVYRNGKARFCVDYRRLNAQTVPDEFPIPRQREILQALSGAQVLSSLDALAGFTQLEVKEEDREKTAFRTHRGLFQFKRMPFGLRNGPSIFQRVMQGILAPYLWLFTLVYIDDIVVYSKTWDEHFEHLDKVLRAIRKSGITLSPTKCHFFYTSILLLGQKVSRLGLSTHEEKVKAISELARPTKVKELQSFIGMTVYFSAFIPYYAFIMGPLFKLLKKSEQWLWGPEEEHSFLAVKDALVQAPVLGHPMPGRPYRVYSDASDEAIGCCLQQVQPIRIKDLKGTRTYEKLHKAHEKGSSVPSLTIRVSKKIDDVPKEVTQWNERDWEETVVLVERVIAYWSRTLKQPERNYSATEREALGVKEALVHFQPFIEGEKNIVITDHSALTWAKVYENTNRRLAAWGAVFRAFDLDIIHRAGRVHSNVDPLSRLPRQPPLHDSPLTDPSITIPAEDTDQERARLSELEAKKKSAESFIITSDWSSWVEEIPLEDVIKLPGHLGQQTQPASAFVARKSRLQNKFTRSRAKREKEANSMPTQPEDQPALPHTDEEGKFESWSEEEETYPTLQVSISPKLSQKFVKGYQNDPFLSSKWEEAGPDINTRVSDQRFFKGEDGLLFFRDADWTSRLVVPKSLIQRILTEAHEHPYSGAHMGAERLFMYLSPRFYWRRQWKSVKDFVATCDVCQKTKAQTQQKLGALKPHQIPKEPYETVSLDLITGLPQSQGYDAILVTVDKLTKHAQFIPTTSNLDKKGFAELFVQHVISRFGMPTQMIADRDPRWAHGFWRETSNLLGTKLMLSTSHHPQTDGQTERMNRTLEEMLRAYLAGNKENWADYLPMLQLAYNSSTHSAAGQSPNFLLMGYQTRQPLDLLLKSDGKLSRKDLQTDVIKFLSTFQANRDAARDALAMAQLKQVRAYNKRHKFAEFVVGQKVLINPHSLELVESKGGKGVKLVQRWIGPFEIQEKRNDLVYKIKLPSNYPLHPWLNIEHLKLYHESPKEWPNRTRLPETREVLDAEDYEVDAIVGHKYSKQLGQMLYVVRWKGFPPSHDSLRTAKQLSNASAILRAYRRTIRPQ